MLNEPVLLIPAFRSGRETPWAGDTLRREFEKYTLGNQIGESYDFSILPNLESIAPNGEALSSVLQRAGISADQVPFLIKWTDADQPMSVHVHSEDEYIVIVRAQPGAKLISTSVHMSDHDIFSDAQLTQNAESVFHANPVNVGDVILIPAGVPHAFCGVTCYQLQKVYFDTYRLYDWNRTNARGQKRSLQVEKALSLLSGKSPVLLLPTDHMLVDSPAFQLSHLKSLENHPLTFNGRFAVLTCLKSAHLQLASGKHMYLTAGQSILIPACDDSLSLTGEHCLLAVSKV